MPGPSPLATWWTRCSAAAGSAVLATGTVSVALDLAGYEVLSRVALTVACAAWLGSAADFALRLVRARAGWVAEAETPGALTTVAATAALGTGLSAVGPQPLAEALLALAVLLWPVPLVRAVRDWGRHTSGTVFLCCVATQGLAVLAATLAAAESAAWLAHAALALFWLGLVLCVLALARFDLRQVAEGAGDHWLAGGALAVSALAGARLLTADSARLYLWNDDDRGVLRTVTVALLVLGLACYVVLLVAELVWPRLRCGVRRWATVFGWGITAAATLSVAAAVDVPWLEGPGKVLLWLAVAAWLAVASARAAVTSAAGRKGLRSRAGR